MKNMKIRPTFSTNILYAVLGAGLCFQVSASVAEESARHEATVLVRKGVNGYELVQKVLRNLDGSKTFSGKHFKIVKGKSNHPIALDDKELGLKAATVYHHLTKAREFWISDLNSERVKTMEKLTVRLEISSRFSDIAHYRGDSHEPNYNNAYTVPGGQTPDWVPEDRQDKWGMEIWFNPAKKIPSWQLVSEGDSPLTRQLLLMRKPIVNRTAKSFTRSVLNRLFYPDSFKGTLMESAFRHAGTLALTYGIIEASRKMDPLFMEDHYYLDTAMIPEIIYHEFAHAALADRMAPTHAAAVSEGMADYFAALVSGETKVYRKIVGYSNNVEKDAYNRGLYHPSLEKSWNATGDFALSLLWKVRDNLSGIDSPMGASGKKLADNLVGEAARELDTEASISSDLPRALMSACSKICPSERKRWVYDSLLKSFEQKGL